MFVNVRVVTQVQDNGLTVPLDAVQQGPQGQFVFVVGAGHKVAMQPVSVRETFNGEALIGKGLSVGETVVVRGQYRLTPGTVVRSTTPTTRLRWRTPRRQAQAVAMNISAAFIRRPIATRMLMAPILLLGFIGYEPLPVAACRISTRRRSWSPRNFRVPMRRLLPAPSRRRSNGNSAKYPA
jgi:hypothetical protein